MRAVPSWPTIILGSAGQLCKCGLWRIATVWLLASSIGCNRSPQPPAPPPAARGQPSPTVRPNFIDVAASAGIDFRYEHHPQADYRTILESLGGGVAMLDYDADGDLDLSFPGGGIYG